MPDDPVRPDVLDHARVELALVGPVFGVVGRPEGVGGWGGDAPLHQFVVDGRGGAIAWRLAALLRGRGPDPVLGAQPPDPSLAHPVACPLELIGEDLLAELRIVLVHLSDHVHQVGSTTSRRQTGMARHVQIA